MAGQAKLTKIWINTLSGQHELRAEWSNDRHQAIQLKGLDAESVEKGLIELSLLLRQERRDEHL